MALSHQSSSLNRSEKAAFWQAVTDCVVHFHHQSRAAALRKVRDLRRKLETSKVIGVGEIIYHDEPFYVACDVAGMHDIANQEELLQQYRTEYRSILEASGW